MEKKRKIYAVAMVIFIIIMQVLPDKNIIQAGNLKNRRLMQEKTFPEPVTNYNFNNSIGTALLVTRENDTLEGSNEGTLPVRNNEKNVIYKEGINGKSIYLDGTYGLKVFPQIDSSNYSVAFWVKPEAMEIYSPFICAGEQFLTEQETCFEITKDDSASPIVISTSPSEGYFAGKGNAITEKAWNHVCITVSGSNIKIYANGNLQSEGKIPGNMVSGSTEWYLGIDPYNVLFKGSIDNLEFYNSCIAPEIVSDIYTNEKNNSAKAKATGITLDKNEATLNSYGSMVSLHAQIQPDNAENQNVKWSSSDTKVATVENGVVYAWKNGSAVITAATEDGNFKSQCNITVKNIIDLEGIKLDNTHISLQGDGSSARLTVLANPVGAYIPQVIWKTSDTNIITTDQSGNITAVANGKALVTAESEDGKFQASCQVTVEGLSKNVSIENVKFTENSIKLTNKDKTHTLVTVITPASAANQQCTYYSEDEDVATVDSKGKVTAAGNGITNVCVITSDGRFEALCKVKVTGFEDTKATELKFDHDSLEIAQGGTGYLYAEATPATSTQDLYWKSSNPEIADVVADEFGTSAEIIVYSDAVMGSTAMITVSTEDGISAECFIKVTEYGVQKLSMGKSNVFLRPGETFNIDTEIKPARAASADLVWKSSNNKVATVNGEGVIRVQESAKAGQKAKITSMTLSEQRKASCMITVKEKKVQVKKLFAKKKNFALYPGGKAKFLVTYTPANATEHNIIYKSQNPGIVNIDQNGNISVPSGYKGTAEVKVTARTRNGKQVSGIVKVKQKEVKIKRLSMSRPSMEVYGGRNTTLYVNYKPLNATKTNVKWTSSNPGIVRVAGSGRKASVQARNNSSKGSATITARDSNGATANCKVSVYPKPVPASKPDSTGTSPGTASQPSVNNNTVNNKPSKAELKEISFGRQTYIEIKAGSQKNLRSLLSISPSNAEYTLTWRSGNNYVSVSSQGIVSVPSKTPKKLECVILVSADNGKKASIKVLVR